MCQQLTVRDLIRDFLTAFFGNNTNRRILNHVAAVSNDCGERRNFVGIHFEFANCALFFVDHCGTGRAAERKGTHRHSGTGRCQQRKARKITA